MSLDLAVKVIGFAFAIVAFSYAFYQQSILFVIPEGLYIGGFTAYSIFQMNKSLRATVLDFIAAGQVILIIPVILGLLAFARLTRFRWLARYPVAVLSGTGAGILFGLTIRGQFLGPIGDTAASVISAALDPVSRALLVVLIVPIILLFLYSRDYSRAFHEKGQRLWYVQRLGRVAFMMFVGYQAAAGTHFVDFINFLQQIVQPTLNAIAQAFLH